MKQLKFLFAAGFSVMLVSSCVVMSKKKYNQLLSDKDSLSSGWNTANIKIESLEEELTRLRRDTASLHERVAELNNQVSELRGNYAALRSNTSSEINKLSEDLKRRKQRLKEVEDILRKRDEASNALKNKLQQALLGFTDKGLTVEMRDGKVYVSLTDKLLFATGSIVIDERGEQALQELAKVLNTQPEINIAVEGHTDSQRVSNLGQIKDNWDLSVLRATSVVRFLTKDQNISPERLTATGKGEFQPVQTENTAEARSKNRRIEIVLSPKLDELYNLIN